MNVTLRLRKFAAVTLPHVPSKLTDRIAHILARLFLRFSKESRNNILKNLRYIFANDEVQFKQLQEYTKNTFDNYARTMVDFLRLGFMRPQDFSVELIGLENIEKALGYDRGCVLLTMHIGNWDYAGSFLAARGVPMSALVEETEPEMYDLYTKHRERLGMKTFPLSKAGYAFLHTIKNNRVLAVLGDRDILKNGITVDFLGGRRNIPRGLGEIIIKRKLPVVFAYMVFNPKDRKERYLGVIEAPVFFDGTTEEFNKTMVAWFEDLIREYPDQWMLFESDWVA
jgi:lauroyl/myristoyl acyltransferase